MLRMFVGIPVSDDYKNRLDSVVETLGGQVRSRVRWTGRGIGMCHCSFSVRSRKRPLPMSGQRCGRLIFRHLSCVPVISAVFLICRTRVMWVGMNEGNDECARLSEAVKDVMEPFGFKRGTQSFMAHLTLGRVKRPEPDDFDSAFAKVSQEWPELRVDKFILWKSDLTPGRSCLYCGGRIPFGSRERVDNGYGTYQTHTRL